MPIDITIPLPLLELTIPQILLVTTTISWVFPALILWIKPEEYKTVFLCCVLICIGLTIWILTLPNTGYQLFNININVFEVF
jgi:hypothetical protein